VVISLPNYRIMEMQCESARSRSAEAPRMQGTRGCYRIFRNRKFRVLGKGTTIAMLRCIRI